MRKERVPLFLLLLVCGSSFGAAAVVRRHVLRRRILRAAAIPPREPAIPHADAGRRRGRSDRAPHALNWIHAGALYRTRGVWEAGLADADASPIKYAAQPLPS